MPLSEIERNKREAAAALLDEMNSTATPHERKLEIADAMMHVRPEAFFQVARIHLEATAYPKYQD